MSDHESDIAKAHADAVAVGDHMAQTFQIWIQSQPDGTVVITGAATGIAKVVGVVLSRITDDDHRAAAAASAIATILVNCNVHQIDVLNMALDVLEAMSLATKEVAGHA